jgi:ribonuclease Z
MGNSERTEPLTMIGPRGLERVVNSLRIIAPELPFEIRYIELTAPVERLRAGSFEITAFRVHHAVPTYGYTVEIPRAGRFQVERAQALGLPVTYWHRLQKGETVEFEGETYYPEMVMGPPRKGLKVAYCTDSRPTRSIVEGARGADLFICEGMYGERGSEERAAEHKHMNFAEAAALAKAAEVRELWLTHFSPALNHPEEFIDVAREIFPNAKTGTDGMSLTLKFTEE